MSIANVRKHWRFLVGVVLIFVALAAAGPLLFYGTGPLFGLLLERPSFGFVLVFGLVFALAVLGWMALVPWAGDKADHMILDSDANDAGDRADG